ncbi:AAA family ATPase [Chondromyces apiculatus]|uniref:RsbR, positive regulator of sigma-B n=1 Tax=Chondromyces apiculatus DSM 436 TaxID=1192034 RepID=A0A017TE00_9BACT|nr:AAA family ATPase [Chondromyces apiculatus]EYF07474.1 RsbR, positive regulator of sigma-B [Chondromyces apiculatus DSM 436]
MLPLKQLIGSPMDPARFLRIAIALSGALSSAHRTGADGGVRADTLLIDEGSRRATLQRSSDFLVGVGRHGTRGVVPTEALPYLAPEQTGRISRASDQRSDLYALGVVLYELLTGAPPFDADGVIEWVHCHIARRPRPLAESTSQLPAPIEGVVMKLLAKMPEDRYQTSAALGRDLAQCLDMVEAGDDVQPFDLGEGDISEDLHIPHKLYGRDAEVAALLMAFERVCEVGKPEMVLVTGHPGIGKSVLVDELYRPVVRRRGMLISSKADQYERGIPYAGIVQALDRVVQRLLMESKARLAQWRQQILDAVGANGQVVLDILPRMELVLGPQPPVQPLPGNEARHRFERVFRQLFGVLASREHPVVLFLDDLQWSDPASLSLLVSLMTHGEIGHLLVIGAYRDNEVGAGHALTAALDEIQKAQIRTMRILLGPLSRDDVRSLVGDTFRCLPEQGAPLGALIHEKTDGNPFFTTQFLSTLVQDGLVTFDKDRLSWRWDLGKIQAARLTDDVIEMMIHKLRRLSEETASALRYAACIGSEFEVDTLTAACEAPRAGLHERLKPAVQSGLLLRFGESYGFLHDRVQQAAYLLIPEAQRGEVHLRIARSLRARTPSEHLGDKVFSIVNQYNLGVSGITTVEERRTVAELGLLAGKKAKSSAAYTVAAGYLAASIALVDEPTWKTSYDLLYALHSECAECEHLSGNAEETRRLCDLILQHGRTKLDKQLAYRLLIERHMAEMRSDKAVEACLDCLKLLGVEISSAVTDADVDEEFRKVWEALGDRSVEALRDLPPMTDPEMQAAVAVLTITFVPAWYVNQTLSHMMMARTLRLSVVHGNAGPSAMNYVTAGMVLIPRFGDYRRSYELAKVGYALAQRDGALYWLSMICSTFGAFAAVWFEPIGRCVEYPREGLDAAQRSGNVTWITLGSMHFLSMMMSSGRRLDEVHRESERLLEIVRSVDRDMGAPILLAMQRSVQCLRGLTSNISTLNGGGFDEEAFEEANPPSTLLAYYYYHARRLQARLFAGEIADAVRSARCLKPVLWHAACQFFVAEGTLYMALALLAHMDEVDAETRAIYRAEIAEHQALLAVWADNCPVNFLAMQHLAAAEVARVDGRVEDALRLYDHAAEAARQNDLVHLEALAKELAGRFCLDRGFSTLAGALLREARACYVRWGADGKVSQLDRRYARLFDLATASAGTMTSTKLEQIDVLTVVKTCQAISSEIDQSKLLSTLLGIIVEHAGAETCHLLVPRADEMVVTGSVSIGDAGIDVTVHAAPLPLACVPLPESMVHYVKRTREQVILDDPASQSLFSSDPYIERVRPKSVLCCPIVRQGTLMGVLYLENNLTLGAFSGRKIALLEFITSQASISMENAALYQALQQENAERGQTESSLRESEDHLRRLVEERAASEATLRDKLDIIEQQQQAITALSTPIIEVWDGVLTMPVLGAVDSRTAAHMMQVMLDAVVRQQARHVIVDLTAVHSLDSHMADHLIRMVRAVHLLGSEGIIVGLRPEVAQTMVLMGIDLASMTTLANLRQALVRCMNRSDKNPPPARARGPVASLSSRR